MDLTSTIQKILSRIHPKLGDFYVWSSQYWNFALVGGIGVFLNYFIWLSLGMSVLAWWVGTFVAWHSNFILDKLWVFKKEKTNIQEKNKNELNFRTTTNTSN